MSGPAASFAPRIAVLIDAENVSWKHAHEVVSTVHQVGGSVIYNTYGREDVCQGWMTQLKAFKPRMITPEPTGKPNAVDMTMMLDAMVYMLRHRVSHMYLVTSDADFVPLIRKLKLHKCRTVVCAEAKASDYLRKACDEFVLLKKA
jgi:uncharacterized protein (TIGR00288 family)